jgi:hypothetical protein
MGCPGRLLGASEESVTLILCSRWIFGLGSRNALGTLLRIAEHVSIGCADDAPAAGPAAEQIALTDVDPGDAVLSCQHAGTSRAFSASSVRSTS